MIQEPLDLRRAMLLVRRHKIIVVTAAALGLLLGAGYAVLRPPTLTAQAWVVLAPPPQGVIAGTQAVIAGSDPVLADALKDVQPAVSLSQLRDRIQVTNETPTILGINAEGQTAAQAESMANAVATSYVNYAGHPGNLPDAPVEARVLQSATTATGTSHSSQLAGASILGALIAAIIASFLVIAAGQRDRRLRQRDEIADSIGVPVVVSMSVQPPADAAGWSSLLERYLPGSVDAWRLRKALQYLGFRDLELHERPHGGGLSLTVISLSFDARALALGPQLAAFAASRGIPTALVVGPQQDVHATATLRAACAQPLPSTPLRLMVADDHRTLQRSGAVLTVIVTVVDAKAPQVRAYEAPEWSDVIADTAGSAATVIAVSAGAATAEQLARVAASAAIRGHDIIGILVADPDPADPTTGRLPQVSRPARARRPKRMTGTAAEASE